MKCCEREKKKFSERGELNIVFGRKNRPLERGRREVEGEG
jgi:hypothetical protein